MKKLWIISGGIFEKNNIALKLKEIEKKLLKKDFWKDKVIVKKTVKEKKIYEDITSSYQISFNETNNLKDLFNLAAEEKNDAEKEAEKKALKKQKMEEKKAKR